MRHILLTAVWLAVFASVTTVEGVSTHCHQYSAGELKSTQCTQTKRDHDRQDFRDFYELMNDAITTEDDMDFVVHSLTGMYMYIHCANETEASAVLFYGADPAHLPSGSSPFWQAAYTSLHGGSPASLLGRRRKRSHSDTDDILLNEKIARVCTGLTPACIQWLIDGFAKQGAAYFKTKYPSFPNPNQYTTTHTPSTTHKPTTPQPTTTHKPTTHIPTTHKPTTHKPTTHIPTTHKPKLTHAPTAVTHQHNIQTTPKPTHTLTSTHQHNIHTTPKPTHTPASTHHHHNIQTTSKPTHAPTSTHHHNIHTTSKPTHAPTSTHHHNIHTTPKPTHAPTATQHQHATPSPHHSTPSPTHQITTTTASTGKCPLGYDWTEFDDSCYLFIKEHYTFFEAQDVCEKSAEGYLVEVETSNENAFVQKLINSNHGSNTWMGIEDMVTDGQYMFAHSHLPVNVTHWAQNQSPYQSNSRDCVVMDHSSGDWRLEPCERKYTSVCEKHQATPIIG